MLNDESERMRWLLILMARQGRSIGVPFFFLFLSGFPSPACHSREPNGMLMTPSEELIQESPVRNRSNNPQCGAPAQLGVNTLLSFIIHHLSFRYHSGETILHDLSLIIHPNGSIRSSRKTYFGGSRIGIHIIFYASTAAYHSPAREPFGCRAAYRQPVDNHLPSSARGLRPSLRSHRSS